MTIKRSDKAAISCHHRALIGIRFAKHGMQRGDDRHVQAAQELQNMRAGWSAKNSVFMLQANQIDVAEIQEVRSLAVRRQLILRKLEANPGGIAIAFRPCR